MPKERKTKVVDGFTVFQAARRATPSAENKETSDAGTSGSDASDPKPRIGSHIGRTVLPTRHDISCYECGFGFQLTGKVLSTFCPKCRKAISLQDLRVEGVSAGDIRTGTTVHVAEDAVVKDGTITAGRIVLEGALSGGRLRAFRWLEVGPTARFDPEAANAARLRVREGAEVSLGDAHFDEVEIFGRLHAGLLSAGRIAVRAGGLLEGHAQGPHLSIEEGGGLIGDFRIAVAAGEAGDGS